MLPSLKFLKHWSTFKFTSKNKYTQRNKCSKETLPMRQIYQLIVYTDHQPTVVKFSKFGVCV